jgi:hypothetical protein
MSRLLLPLSYGPRDPAAYDNHSPPDRQTQITAVR